MDTIFMNSKNNKTSDPHSLLLNLKGKVGLRRKDKSLLYQDVFGMSHWYVNQIDQFET